LSEQKAPASRRGFFVWVLPASFHRYRRNLIHAMQADKAGMIFLPAGRPFAILHKEFPKTFGLAGLKEDHKPQQAA